MPKSDIEIARDAKMQPITKVGEKLGVPADALMQFGPSKAKLSFSYLESLKKNKDGMLILVTAISPTPAGRSEEHTSELQSLIRTSYAVFCLNKKTTHTYN